MANVYKTFRSVVLENKGFLDFNPIETGFSQCDVGCSCGPIKRSRFIAHYVVSGKGTVIIEEDKYDVKSGEVFLLPPDKTVLYYANNEDPWEYIWIGFDGKLSERFFELESPVFPFDKRIFEEIKMIDLYPDTKEEYLVTKLFEIYMELFGKRKKSDVVTAVADYIDHSFSEPISIENIAKDVMLDRHHLSRIFKAKTGVTMQQYLVDKRLNQAKKLLLTGMDISVCCEAVGYNDIFNFSKAFKKKFGISPGKFKKNNAK